MLLHLERNEPCICRSGRKYKRCCLRRVESAARILQGVTPGLEMLRGWGDLVNFLALAVGLKEGYQPDDVPLDLDEATKALRTLYAALEASGQDQLLTWHDRLVTEFQQNSALTHVRFFPERVAEMTASLMDDPGWEPPNDSETRLCRSELSRGEQIRCTVIDELVDDDFRLETALCLLDACRKPHESGHLSTLVWYVWCLIDQGLPGDNPFFMELFSLTLDELASADEELAELRPEFGSVAALYDVDPERADHALERLRAIFDEYPSMELNMSRRFVDQVAPAVEAFMDGRLHISMPLWAGLGGYILAIEAHTEGKGPLRSGKLTPDDIDWSQAAWDVDGPAFTEVARGYVEAAAFDVQLDDTLRNSLAWLALSMGPVVSKGQLSALISLYMSSFSTMHRPDGTLATGLPDDHPLTLTVVDVLNPDRLEEYAQALDDEGNELGADAVRSCIGEFFREGEEGEVTSTEGK